MTTRAYAADTRSGEALLSVRDLSVVFQRHGEQPFAAVDGVSFEVRPGQTVGLVGESGSGKSVTSLAIMGLLDDNAKITGSIVFDGEELLGKSDKQMSVIRGNGMAMVFQDPLTSLTPVFTIGDQLIEALTAHRNLSKQDAWDRSLELLRLVGITNPEKRMKSFPHEFSGGM
ncbi:MAG: ABC transporter ATP-binding protein, partial [Tetrasphaera sp.]|nr:ABC transporter ATP-binding protein [Tetrasphaera sp.]